MTWTALTRSLPYHLRRLCRVAPVARRTASSFLPIFRPASPAPPAPPAFPGRLQVRLTLSTSGDGFDYETESDETLESLCEHFEILLERDFVPESVAEGADVTLASGVLNVVLPGHGTYVINKQSPNRQIWLSSPLSGPWRFDFESSSRSWVYHRTGQSLHRLLDDEIGRHIFRQPQSVGFIRCHLGGEA